MKSSRTHERQVDKLLAIIERQNDRIMYLAGRTWGEPPTQEIDRSQHALDAMIDSARYSFAPEQDPEEVETY